MNLVVAAAVLLLVFAEVALAHRYFRRQRRICATYPFYTLRDQVVLSMIEEPDTADAKEPLYRVLNRIVHHTDKFGWKFLSDAVAETTRAVLEGKTPPNALSSHYLQLVDLVVDTAKTNSFLVRLSLSRFGRLVLVVPILKGVRAHLKEKEFRRLDTTRQVIRLHEWRHLAA